ncbi:hypothetical protein CPM_0969 [Cuniculiplasma divulgatum]|uniref:Uncharacterized protein n=1 Tax=Cuniculiplasma divulgatum TaxID=1673428 RepID=A0A1R4A753_9ARCH|nr:hypothetical protein CPM_0969 [Cuniculiplasma divulgatum]
MNPGFDSPFSFAPEYTDLLCHILGAHSPLFKIPYDPPHR